MHDPVAGGLTRQEGAGLAIAALAHAGLLAFLMLSPPGKTIKPPPERMEVTFSDEIADQSTSPDPLAEAAPDVAPELGEPQPAPVVEPQPLPEPPKPVPAPPQPKPVPAPPKPAPKPQPPDPGSGPQRHPGCPPARTGAAAEAEGFSAPGSGHGP